MKNVSAFGHKALVWVQDVGLMIIAIATIIAVAIEVASMVEAKTVTLADLLLLALSILVIRFGHTRFPYNKPDYS